MTTSRGSYSARLITLFAMVVLTMLWALAGASILFQRAEAVRAEAVRVESSRQVAAREGTVSGAREPSGTDGPMRRWRRDAFLFIAGTLGATLAILILARGVSALLERREDDAEEVRRAWEAAQVADQAKGHFLSLMSHELRTPLNIVIGFSEVIRDDDRGELSAADVREFAVDIARSGHSLLGIVNGVLDIVRVSGGWVPGCETVDLDALVIDNVRRVQEAATARDVTVTVDLADAPPALRGDRSGLSRALAALLANAVAYTRLGGRVTVTARRHEGGLLLAVHDDGPGIPPDDLERVQQPFEQGDASRARRYEGAGLGLPLARAFTEAHGGTLTLSSSLDEGTTAALWFPDERVIA